MRSLADFATLSSEQLEAQLNPVLRVALDHNRKNIQISEDIPQANATSGFGSFIDPVA